MIAVAAAALAALLFLIALILDVLDTAGDAQSTLMLAGLLCVAVALAAYFARVGNRRVP